MDQATATRQPVKPFLRWLLEGHPAEGEDEHGQEEHTHAWWQVMCLTGVDYFSTLGYQPGIAALAAGALSPLATLVLVLLTLFGALPIYNRVAEASPRGEGSIAMLENLLSWWSSKLFVLCLLGFVATDFIITMTLSAADATEHITENPFVPAAIRHENILVTLLLLALLSGIFLKGFKEAIGLAVLLVGAYLALNLVVVGDGMLLLWHHPEALHHWSASLLTQPPVGGRPWMAVAMALFLFPKLALGLSGFETGVAVMPLVRGDGRSAEERLAARIRNTRRLLLTAALIMSVFLIASSIVTITLIPAAEFHEGGRASGRALAFLAHEYLGSVFGTVYDISTISILWFAGASAMAGLLNIVPRYLPRYGMAPEWTRAARPLVLVFTAIAFAVTLIFRANVVAQGGAYATGVLVLMSSAAIAVTLAIRRRGRTGATFLFGLISAVFVYTTVVNVFERPAGIKIAAFFIGAIIVTSLVSRLQRTTEVRTHHVELDDAAERFVEEAAKTGEFHIIANKRQAGDAEEYRLKLREACAENRIPPKAVVLFLEVDVTDASEFANVLEVHGAKIPDPDGDQYRVLRAESAAVPNGIAAFLLMLRDRTGIRPNAYFTWSEGSPLVWLLRYVLFGQGDTAPVTREVLRRAEPDPEKRPEIHVA